MKKLLLAFAFIGFLATSSFATTTVLTSSFDVELCDDDKKCDKKSCKNLTEKTLVTPQELVPSLKASIQNPANLCEGVAADGWIRGGLPSRELSRDQDYFSKCN